MTDWFEKKLYTEHKEKLNERDPQVVECVLVFDEVRRLEIRDKTYPVKRIGFRGTSIYKHKRIWVNWSGDAFYDWHTDIISIPAQGVLVTSSVPSDLAQWPDYDGEIPTTPARPGYVRIVMHDDIRFKDDLPVPDLMSL